MTREEKQHFTFRITQANATEMVVILYDMLLHYLEEAETAVAGKDVQALHQTVRCARGCLNELIQSLHMEYEPAPAMMRLYLFCLRRLARGDVQSQAEPFQEVRRVIEPLRDAYRQIAGNNNAGPLMGNSQAVYAGLTYGKNSLTENMADQGPNRGMYA